ncbi:MAG: D-tyrosyl-tRNA(Tyr) deacylase [Methanolinea sp.]|nr:D-tyrosyl-tRNA(Tyr) deacylase [Methanolinea sp.]
MKIALVSSRQDPGGCTIHDAIVRLLDERKDGPYPLEEHHLEIVTVDERLIYQDHLDRSLDAELIIFLSRHSSVHPVPVLTVHVTGNLDGADFGGHVRSLAAAAPGWMHSILRNLSRNAPGGFRAGYEVTHHGPSEIATPCLFVEVGSTEKEWKDPVAGEAAALSVLQASPEGVIPLIGFGGTHYAPRQTHIALSSKGAFGHIAHSREVPSLDELMVREMGEKTGAVAAYIDKKALSGGEVEKIHRLLEPLGLPIIQEGDLVAMGNLSWETYCRILALAEEIMPGGNVRLSPMGNDGAPVPVDVPPDLLDEAAGCNLGELRKGMQALPVVSISTPKKAVLSRFITMEGDSGRVRHDLISLCVNIIRRGERTAVAGDHLTIHRHRFDPGKARDLGVPQGPLFGKLRDGCIVQLGERVITPEMVQTCIEKRIHIPGLENYL